MRPIEEKLIYLESRLDNVENELHMLTHKKFELEERRKNLLERINKLHGEREIDTRIAYIKQRNGL